MAQRTRTSSRHEGIDGDGEAIEERMDGETLDGDAASETLRPRGWRHGAAWTYGVTLVASAVALLTSFILAADTLYIARHPGTALNCDVNATLSCSAVAQSWQAEIIKLGDLSFPNAFFGIAAESVFATIAVIGMARVAVPRWFAICTWWGGLAALAYSYWLTSQSLFVIEALCPWCLLLMASTTIQFMALTHATVTVRGLPRGDGRLDGLRRFLDSYYRPGLDLLIDVVWVALIAAVILVKDGPALFA